MKPLHFLLAALGAALPAVAAETVESPHVTITYSGVTEAQARAIADTLSAARQVYATDFGLDMPEKVHTSVTCDRGQPTRLYTDGNDRVFLHLPSSDKLLRPGKSGVFNLYGLCHELGHVAMYRTLKNRDWLSGAGAEGFAHYAGSVVLDQVHAAKGDGLWAHDPYNYKGDGSARLTRQLAAARPDEITRAAGHFLALEQVVGRKAFARLLAAWNDAKVDPADPAPALLAVSVAAFPEKKEPLSTWWNAAGPLMVTKVESSAFKAATAAANKLTGQPVTIALDDDTADGKKSLAGGAHARRFATPAAGAWYLTGVTVHAARYGPAAAPATNFDLVLCDAEMKPVATWKFLYGTVARGGESQWTKLPLPAPTRVPAEFHLCLNFRPTASSGVFVSFDASTKGASLTSPPGGEKAAFAQGDWMIRATLDQPKEADALK